MIHRTMCIKCPKNLMVPIRFNGDLTGTVQIWPFSHCTAPVTHNRSICDWVLESRRVVLWSLLIFIQACRTCIACSFAHFYLGHTLKSGLIADSSALVPKCRMDTVTPPVLNSLDISDPSQWCGSVWSLKCFGSHVSVIRSVCTPPSGNLGKFC